MCFLLHLVRNKQYMIPFIFDKVTLLRTTPIYTMFTLWGRLSRNSPTCNMKRHLKRVPGIELEQLAQHHSELNLKDRLPRMLSKLNVSLRQVRNSSLHQPGKTSFHIPYSDSAMSKYLPTQASTARSLVFEKKDAEEVFNMFRWMDQLSRKASVCLHISQQDTL